MFYGWENASLRDFSHFFKYLAFINADPEALPICRTALELILENFPLNNPPYYMCSRSTQTHLSRKSLIFLIPQKIKNIYIS